MFTLSNCIAIATALISIFAVYKGGQERSRLHLASALSGAIVILCIAGLPYFLMQSLASTDKAPPAQQYAFIAYLLLFAVAAIVALACCVRLIFRRA